MTTKFHLHIDELDERLLNALKILFDGKAVTLTVETEVISENTQRILDARQDEEEYVFVDDEFDKVSEALLSGESIDLEKFKRSVAQ
jgi:hypothetical protein